MKRKRFKNLRRGGEGSAAVDKVEPFELLKDQRTLHVGHQGLRHNLDYHSCEGEKCKNQPISQEGEKIKLILSSSKVMVLCTYMRHLFLFLGPMIVFFCCKPRLLLVMVLLQCCQHNNMLCETGVHEHHLKRLNDMEKWPLIGDSPCTCEDRASNPVSDKHCNYR